MLIKSILRIKYHRVRVGREYRGCLEFRWFAFRQPSICCQVRESTSRQFLRVIKVRMLSPLSSLCWPLALTPDPCCISLVPLQILPDSCLPRTCLHTLPVPFFLAPSSHLAAATYLPACLNASHLVLSAFCFILC